MPARKPLPVDIVSLVLHEAGYRCANPVCRTIITLDIHHIVRVADGGPGTPDNLLPICPNCHSLHHKDIIPASSIRAWKMLLLSLNHAFDQRAIDILLTLSTMKRLDVQGEGVLQCAGLIASGLVMTDVASVSATRFLKLTDKGRHFVQAWKDGKQDEAIAAASPLTPPG